METDVLRFVSKNFVGLALEWDQINAFETVLAGMGKYLLLLSNVTISTLKVKMDALQLVKLNRDFCVLVSLLFVKQYAETD